MARILSSRAARPDERLGEAVTAYVEGAPLPATAEKKLFGLLAERLDKYEVPKAILYVPAFRSTASGKLDRAATVRSAGEPK
ncbi:MAG: hypothetical protein EOO36_22390 [Cytophagaceae bacterium]|nr:MAG: hypothetical protein EOO36_22390 [Cytophagaceae bacterium]